MAGSFDEALSALNDTLRQDIADLSIGTLPGASDINAGFTLISGYLVRGPRAHCLG